MKVGVRGCKNSLVAVMVITVVGVGGVGCIVILLLLLMPETGARTAVRAALARHGSMGGKNVSKNREQGSEQKAMRRDLEDEKECDHQFHVGVMATLVLVAKATVMVVV